MSTRSPSKSQLAEWRRRTYQVLTGDVVATASSFCGVEFTEAELKSLSKEEIQSITDTSSGRDMKCMEVPTGAVLPFTIVFFDYPKEASLKVSNTRVLESKALGE